ncbi:hypothetical protein GN958_ATG22471 [Phytophthora infestans]|uniref:Uncharacterized protein n=1 Tax=Phytophthora infestans TaxID=4787 RepID=A0A8S9TK77_PHYIN|nr:hypothetical protein GN958_ATG22471 [Phytophthora infestans]
MTVGRVESKWTDINSPLGSNAVFDIETRVGVTLFNLTHKGSFEVAGSIFGTGKTQAIAHEDQVSSIVADRTVQVS